MKKITLVFMVLIGLQSIAQAESNAEAILNHSALKAVESLLQQKHNGKCKIPSSESDIHWMCFGAIEPVTAPRIDATGCGASLKIECPTENVNVFARTISYFLNSPRPNGVAPTPTMVTIENISFEQK